MSIAQRQICGAAAILAAVGVLAAGSASAEPAPPAAGADARLAAAERWDLQQRLTVLNQQRLARAAEARKHAATRTVEPESDNPSILTDPAAREKRIDRHRPAPHSSGHLPAPLLQTLNARWGDLLALLAIDDGARDAYARAIALGRNDIASWRSLARMRRRTGDLDGAEGALLAALDLSYASSTPTESATVHRELGALYLFMHRPGDAGAALERAQRQAPKSTRILQLLGRARHEFAPNIVPAPPRPVPLWPETSWEERRARWQAALEGTHAAMPPFLQRILDSAAAFATSARGLESLAYGLAAALFVWYALRRFKGSGDLTVTIAYPAELAGSFRVRLATQPGRFKRSLKGATTGNGASSTRTSTRTEHYGISRETQFHKLRARRYYVTLEGMLHDPGSGEVITNPFDEQTIEVTRDGVTHMDFDVAPRESLVDVRITWNKQPARDAAVAARGFPQSLRFARDGTTRLRLRKGVHTIVIGSGDRVAECEVDLDSFRASTIDIDLGNSEKLIFKGCPPAVEPYVHGDLSAAARALEHDGHTALANLLLAKLHKVHGRMDRAAHHFELAERPLDAAELRAELGAYEQAATLFRQAGAPGRAGEMLREAGELVRAGDCFEQADDFENAAACYRDAEAIPQWIDAVERSGEVFEAAKLAVLHRDQSRTIRLLQQVPPDHPHRGDALEMLANAYILEGHRDLAIDRIEERIQSSSPEETSPNLHAQLAELLEEEGELCSALDVLSALRERDPTFPNIATRIEGIRKKQSQQKLSESRPGATSETAPTAFLSESRYEILEEIGRGGMGVVLKARDTRLQRTVALKRLPDTLRDHPKAIALFLREAQSAARLNHPNITTVYDTDQQDGVFFITMELLEGLPISKILKQRGHLSARNAAQLGLQVAAGLDYAHQKGIVHRDIKSANLFFTRDKVVKIMDFGLAKMMEEVRRGTTVIGGTPYYMAPEQAAGEKVDQRADIYAFGVTLYEFLTSKVPFTEGDVTYHHRHTPVPDPRAIVADIPEEMVELVLAMLAKRPEDRIGTAAEVHLRLTGMITPS